MTTIEIAMRSRGIFFLCVEECNACYRTGADLRLYREIVAQHRQTANLSKLLDSDGFINLIRRTLVEWNMNQRGARLGSEAELEKSIAKNRPALEKLYNYKLHELNRDSTDKVTDLLELVFGGLKVMNSKRRIVGVSKALHFLIPDLVMPIDSTYTMQAIYGYNRYSDNIEKETEDFIHIFRRTVKIARDLNLTPKDVSGEGWNTSVPKLIDNAVIGLFSFVKNKTIDELMEKIKIL